MNFKKMKKRFFSLSRGNGGFTLVELIVVIAILAILGGVAVPAYSGYVEKANMGADQTLVGEVAHALSLYYYKNGGNGGGYVILTADGASADETVGEPAMVAVFGEGWEDSLALKYENWGEYNNGGMLSVALAQGMGGVAGMVGDSSFLKGSTPAELLTNVTDLTYVATGLFEDMNDDIKYSVIMNNLFNGDPTLLQNYCKDFGIKTTTDNNGATIFSNDVTNEQLSNLLVFGAANQLMNGQPSSVTSLVGQYASYAGYVNSLAGTESAQAANAAYTVLNEQLSKDNNGDGKINSTDIQIAFDNFHNNENIKTGLNAYIQEDNPQYATDMTSFMCIMDAVNHAAGEVTPDEMKSKDFFTSNKVSGFFDNYIASADAVGKMGAKDIETLLGAIESDSIAILLTEGPQTIPSIGTLLP